MEVDESQMITRLSTDVQLTQSNTLSGRHPKTQTEKNTLTDEAAWKKQDLK